MEWGEIRYAAVAGRSIAYRVVTGDAAGGADIAMLHAPIASIEALAEDRIGRRLIEGLALAGRLVMFDPSGIGLSGSAGNTDARDEQLAEELEAVATAAGMERPTLFGWMRASAAVPLLAVAHPGRVAGIVLFNPLIGDAARAAWKDTARRASRGEPAGTGFPTRWEDPTFRTWLQTALQRSMNPAERFEEMTERAEVAADVDLGQVSVPTLVVRRFPSESPLSSAIEEVAEAIPGASFVDLGPGEAHAIGEGVDDLLAAITRFVIGRTIVPRADRHVAVILFSDLVDSTRRSADEGDAAWRLVLDHHDAVCEDATRRFDGEVIKMTGDGMLAVFPSATAAVAAARAVRSGLGDRSLHVRIGIHLGEIERRNTDISGIAVNIAARVMAEAESGEILVTDLVARVTDEGCWESVGHRALKGIPETWELFTAI